MDDTDEKVLNFLNTTLESPTAAVVRTYENTLKGKKGAYLAIVKVTDEGPSSGHHRFTLEAFNKETDKGTSSNSFPQSKQL